MEVRDPGLEEHVEVSCSNRGTLLHDPADKTTISLVSIAQTLA